MLNLRCNLFQELRHSFPFCPDCILYAAGRLVADLCPIRQDQFEIGEGERLLVDLDPPEAVYWNLTSASIWHESQRYLTDPVSLTSDEVTFEATFEVLLTAQARHDIGIYFATDGDPANNGEPPDGAA